MRLTDIRTFRGSSVQLEPLSLDHVDGLRAASAEITEDLWYTSTPTPDTMAEDVTRRLELRDAGTMNPFAVRSLADDRIVGSTTFCNIQVEVPRVEIGYTWYAPSVRATALNPEAKMLLLGYAFDECDAIAVQLCTHFHNRRSRAAIEKLGAKQDGVLRNHQYGPDGTLRDTVVYSILPHEWPTVKTGLRARIANFTR